MHTALFVCASCVLYLVKPISPTHRAIVKHFAVCWIWFYKFTHSYNIWLSCSRQNEPTCYRPFECQGYIYLMRSTLCFCVSPLRKGSGMPPMRSKTRPSTDGHSAWQACRYVTGVQQLELKIQNSANSNRDQKVDRGRPGTGKLTWLLIVLGVLLKGSGESESILWSIKPSPVCALGQVLG